MNDNFWESFTDSLLNAGSNYFNNQQNAQTTVALGKINASTIESVVKFGAVVLGLVLVARAIFGGKKLF